MKTNQYVVIKLKYLDIDIIATLQEIDDYGLTVIHPVVFEVVEDTSMGFRFSPMSPDQEIYRFDQEDIMFYTPLAERMNSVYVDICKKLQYTKSEGLEVRETHSEDQFYDDYDDEFDNPPPKKSNKLH